jgi:hypothetical protein
VDAARPRRGPSDDREGLRPLVGSSEQETYEVLRPVALSAALPLLGCVAGWGKPASPFSLWMGKGRALGRAAGIYAAAD